MNIYNGGEVNLSKYSKCANNTEDVNNIVSRTYGSTESSTIFLSAVSAENLLLLLLLYMDHAEATFAMHHATGKPGQRCAWFSRM